MSDDWPTEWSEASWHQFHAARCADTRADGSQPSKATRVGVDIVHSSLRRREFEREHLTDRVRIMNIPASLMSSYDRCWRGIAVTSRDPCREQNRYWVLSLYLSCIRTRRQPLAALNHTWNNFFFTSRNQSFRWTNVWNICREKEYILWNVDHPRGRLTQYGFCGRTLPFVTGVSNHAWLASDWLSLDDTDTPVLSTDAWVCRQLAPYLSC